MNNLEVNQISPQHGQAISLLDLPIFNNSRYLLKPFDSIIIDFFDAMAKSILSNKSINNLPEMVALGFG